MPIAAARLGLLEMPPVIHRPDGTIPVVYEQPDVATMAGHSDIGEVAVHGAGRENIGLIHGRALGFVDSDGVAVIEAAEV